MLPSNPRAGRSKSASRQPPSQTRSAGTPRESPSWQGDGGSAGRDTWGRIPRNSEERPLRSQQSMGSIQRPRAHDQSMPPPIPRAVRERTSPSATKYTPHGPRSRVSSSTGSDSSASSVITSSSSGSFLDRMRHRYPASSSSVSSFETEQESPGSGKEDTSSKEYANTDYRSDAEPAANDFASYSAYGQAIWNRVATAANTWTWPGTNANGITTGSIIGRIHAVSDSKDSEITRVLKAYHISKAKERSDLPEWLFSESERRVDASARRSGSDENSSLGDQSLNARRRGLRDIYDSAAAEASAPVTRTRDDGRIYAYGSDTSSFSDAQSSSKATNRLRAMRDAKRQAATAASSTGRVGDSGGYDAANSRGGDSFGSKGAMSMDRRNNYVSGYADGMSDMGRSSERGGREMGGPEQRMARPRVGLPTHPRGR